MTSSETNSLCRQILALLEEAGGEDALTLANVLAGGQYRLETIADLQEALLTMLREGLIRLSQAGGEGVSTREQSEDFLSTFADKVHWNKDSWQWLPVVPATSAVLTDAGAKRAQYILAKYGWGVRGSR